MSRTLYRFILHYFPQANKKPCIKQKKYMRSVLIKPKGVRINQMFSRINQMNNLLPLFPSPGNTMFSDEDLVEIIISMCPNTWLMDMAKMDFEPSEVTMLQLQTTLERIELVKDTEKLKIKNEKLKEKPDEEECPHRKRRKNKEANTTSSNKHCSLCQILGKNYKNHTTDQCNRRNQVKTLYNKNPDIPKKKNRIYKKEINAIIAKKVKTITNKRFRVAGISLSSSEENSDE